MGWKKFKKFLGKVVKPVAAIAAIVFPPLIPAIGAALGATGAAASIVGAAALSTGASLASGDSLKEALTTGAISGLTAGLVNAAAPSVFEGGLLGSPSGMTATELAQADLALGGVGGTAGATELGNALATGAPTVATTSLTGGSGLITGAQAGITAESVAAKLAEDAGLLAADGVGMSGLGGTGNIGNAADAGMNAYPTTGNIGAEVTPITTPSPVTAPATPAAPSTPITVSDALRAAGLVATVAGAGKLASSGTGGGGFDIVPIPADWTSPPPTSTAAFTPLPEIDFGNKEMLRGTQWERLLSPDYGKAPAPTQYAQPNNMSYDELTRILGGSRTSVPTQNLTINDVISGIQNQYGQAPKGAVG